MSDLRDRLIRIETTLDAVDQAIRGKDGQPGLAARVDRVERFTRRISWAGSLSVGAIVAAMTSKVMGWFT